MLYEKFKILVFGVGNSILTDEGIGVHLVNRLRKENLPANVELVDAGTDGMQLLDYAKDAYRVIILDCVKGGGEPGAIYGFKPDDIDVKTNPLKLSYHDYGVFDFIALARFLDILPPTIIFGMEPAVIEWGLELSPAIEAKMDKMMGFVIAEIERYHQEMVSTGSGLVMVY